MIDIQETLQRLCDIAQVALQIVGLNVTAQPSFLSPPGAPPYLLARTVDHRVTVDPGYPNELLEHTATVVLRLVIGHVTEGYAGEPEAKLSAAIPAVIRALASKPLLQTTMQPTPQTHLVGADVVSCTGLRVFEAPGLAAQQVGCEFVVNCRFNETIRPV